MTEHQETEWQPIETAPTYGGDLLLACRFDDGSFQLHVGCKWGEGWGSDGYKTYQPLIDPKPTYWMPLPPPPKEQK